MRAAVEISLYPLNTEYIAPIKAFIERLNSHGDIKVLTNSMSTQIFGELDRVMSVLALEIEKSSLDEVRRVFVMKVIPGLAPP
jgi:uncharacterized protein YqgV (UPF0045/DUF77 family)